MSLSSAMLSAVSGLATASRLAGVASNNIANAQTPGYVRRAADVTSIVLDGAGTGVTVSGIRREASPLLLAERRESAASAAAADTTQDFLVSVEKALGDADSADSLVGRIAAFESALISAASRPESQSQLLSVWTAASALAGHLNDASAAVQSSRAQADAEISAQVTSLNDALAQVASLNDRIRVAKASGADANDLIDLRQKTVDGISAIIPVREYARDGGEIALFSTRGAVLVDGRASVFGFAAAGAVTSDQTVENGGLGGLSLNGRAVGTGLIAGGSLAANFTIRDDLGPQMQANLDAVARSLVERFQDEDVDTTLGPGDPGLFTDSGAAFAPANESGLAGRIALNSAADPDAGGSLARLRDGLGAAALGEAGDSSLLIRLKEALTQATTAASGASFATGQHSLSGFASAMSSDVATRRINAEAEASFSAARLTAVTEQEAALGVDTDAELQDLMQIEKSYAANARVLQVLDQMLQTVMEI